MLHVQQAIIRRSLRRAFWVVACCAFLAAASPAGTLARFSGVRASSPSAFRGIVFSPSTAPTVTVTRSRGQVTLSWTAVTASNGATVQYRVMRIPMAGSPIQVCTGTAAPTTSGGTVSCPDTAVGANPVDKYTEQPYVEYLGQMTWSLAASTPA